MLKQSQSSFEYDVEDDSKTLGSRREDDSNRVFADLPKRIEEKPRWEQRKSGVAVEPELVVERALLGRKPKKDVVEAN
jgi:hypothetical protein